MRQPWTRVSHDLLTASCHVRLQSFFVFRSFCEVNIRELDMPSLFQCVQRRHVRSLQKHCRRFEVDNCQHESSSDYQIFFFALPQVREPSEIILGQEQNSSKKILHHHTLTRYQTELGLTEFVFNRQRRNSCDLLTDGTTAKAFAQGCFQCDAKHDKLGDRRLLGTVVLLTINHVEIGGR